MSKPEQPRRIRFDQGPTAVELAPNEIRIASRGSTLIFTNVNDFMDFISELGIIAVRIDQAIPELRGGGSEHTDEEENPT